MRVGAGSAVEALDRQLVEHLTDAPDDVFARDRREVITCWNRGAEALFGYAHEVPVRKHVEILLPDALEHGHDRHRAAYVRNPHTRRMGTGREPSRRRRVATEFPAEISISMVKSNGRQSVVAAIRDVSERVRARRKPEALRGETDAERACNQMQHAQRLEILGELAGGVDHHFDNRLKFREALDT